MHANILQICPGDEMQEWRFSGTLKETSGAQVHVWWANSLIPKEKHNK